MAHFFRGYIRRLLTRPGSAGVLMVCVAASFAGPALGAILVSDPFADGNRDQAGGTNDPFGIPWYALCPTGNGSTLTVGNDSGLNNDGALQLTSTIAGNSIRAVGKFASSPQTLLSSTGDKIILTIDFRLSTNYNQTNGLRIGLANSGSTPLTTDQNGNSTNNAVDDSSYSVAINTGSTTTGSNLFFENGSQPGIMGGTDYTTLTTAGTQISINDTLKRTLIFSVTKTSTGVSLEAIIKDSAGNVLTDLTATPATTITAFDEIAFGNGASNVSTGINIDSVTLETVPEPGTLGLAAAGLLGLSTLRRRRRA